jgi:hypothetical protein
VKTLIFYHGFVPLKPSLFNSFTVGAFNSFGVAPGIPYMVNERLYPARLNLVATIKRDLHTPQLIIRKLKTADQLIVQGKSFADVCRVFEVVQPPTC